MKIKLSRYALSLLLIIIGGSSCGRTSSDHNHDKQRPDDSNLTTDEKGFFRHEYDMPGSVASSDASQENAHTKDRVSIPKIFNHSLLGFIDQSTGKTLARIDQGAKCPKIFKIHCLG